MTLFEPGREHLEPALDLGGRHEPRVVVALARKPHPVSDPRNSALDVAVDGRRQQHEPPHGLGIQRRIEQRQRAAEAVADDVDAVFAGHRGHGAHGAAHETLDVVGEIREAVLAARRAEVGDVDVEARRGDVAGERAAGQEIHDEVAADGRRHEQHGRRRTRGRRFRRATAAGAACSRGRRRWRASPRCRSGPASSKFMQALELAAAAAGQVEQGFELALLVALRLGLRFVHCGSLGFPRAAFLPSVSFRRAARRVSSADPAPVPRAGATRTGFDRACRRPAFRARRPLARATLDTPCPPAASRASRCPDERGNLRS